MEAADARVGTTVGNYRLIEVLGRGGMGVVYLAEHVYIGKQFAVKILHDRYAGRDEAVQRFLREARAASLINHPNIVDVTDFGEAPGSTVFFVMEYLKGRPLDVVIQRDGRLDLLRSITILNQMTRALGAAHAMGIVHRDLKPENVILTKKQGRRDLVRRVVDARGERVVVEREGTYDFVKILDFGVAKMIEPRDKRTTQHGTVMGTPEYMAPETARTGVADARSDIYSLGVMFYEMLTGYVPFEGDSAMDVMMKHVSERVVPPRARAPGVEITVEAERVILRALEKDPDLRQQTMAELHDDLQLCYGSVRYRRAEASIPPAAAFSPQPEQAPIRLTKVKALAAPVRDAPDPEPVQPILLTRRKSGGPAALPPPPPPRPAGGDGLQHGPLPVPRKKP